MTLVEHAKKEVELAGLLDEDSDYDGMIGEAVIELAEVFGKQGHSGFSAMYTLSIFDKVARFQNLTPLTGDPDEWMNVTDNLWQNKRNPEAFSTDSGKTWYLLSEKEAEYAPE
jgi:hypothetical protein